MVQGAVEIEVKIRLLDRSTLLGKLEAEGFVVSVPRLFEANALYDRSDGPSLRSANMLLRLRQAGETAVITWKGPGQSGPHKARPELETSIGSLATVEKIFGHLGLTRTFRYEKYRTEYRNPQDPAGVVTVDETPIGEFLELEGPPDWIDGTAVKLGFSNRDYILESYGTLYQAYCSERGIAPTDMTFIS